MPPRRIEFPGTLTQQAERGQAARLETGSAPYTAASVPSQPAAAGNPANAGRPRGSQRSQRNRDRAAPIDIEQEPANGCARQPSPGPRLAAAPRVAPRSTGPSRDQNGADGIKPRGNDKRQADAALERSEGKRARGQPQYQASAPIMRSDWDGVHDEHVYGATSHYAEDDGLDAPVQERLQAGRAPLRTTQPSSAPVTLASVVSKAHRVLHPAGTAVHSNGAAHEDAPVHDAEQQEGRLRAVVADVVNNAEMRKQQLLFECIQELAGKFGYLVDIHSLSLTALDQSQPAARSPSPEDREQVQNRGEVETSVTPEPSPSPPPPQQQQQQQQHLPPPPPRDAHTGRLETMSRHEKAVVRPSRVSDGRRAPREISPPALRTREPQRRASEVEPALGMLHRHTEEAPAIASRIQQIRSADDRAATPEEARSDTPSEASPDIQMVGHASQRRHAALGAQVRGAPRSDEAGPARPETGPDRVHPRYERNVGSAPKPAARILEASEELPSPPGPPPANGSYSRHATIRGADATSDVNPANRRRGPDDVEVGHRILAPLPRAPQMPEVRPETRRAQELPPHDHAGPFWGGSGRGGQRPTSFGNAGGKGARLSNGEGDFGGQRNRRGQMDRRGGKGRR